MTCYGTDTGAQHFSQVVRSIDGRQPQPRIPVAGCGQRREALVLKKLGRSLRVDIGENWDEDLVSR